MKLSRMDEMALCGFVKNPLMSIRELADFLDVNYWTLYKSIERLKRKGVFKEVDRLEFFSSPILPLDLDIGIIPVYILSIKHVLYISIARIYAQNS